MISRYSKGFVKGIAEVVSLRVRIEDKRHAFDNINFICECDFYLRNGLLCNLKKNMKNTEFIWKNCASLNASIVYFLVST